VLAVTEERAIPETSVIVSIRTGRINFRFPDMLETSFVDRIFAFGVLMVVVEEHGITVLVTK